MLDPAGALPLYQQLKQALRRSLEPESWAVDQAIPPERELMGHYGVSRITVRQALADLVTEGLLYLRQGKGTYVAPRPPRSCTAPGRFPGESDLAADHLWLSAPGFQRTCPSVLTRQNCPGPPLRDCWRA